MWHQPAKPPQPPRIKQSIQITTHFHFDTLSLRALSIASKNQNGFAAAGQREETAGSVYFLRSCGHWSFVRNCLTLCVFYNAELQLQYSNYKNALQSMAQKIGDIEQETEEHKWVCLHWTISSQPSKSINVKKMEEDIFRLTTGIIRTD